MLHEVIYPQAARSYTHRAIDQGRADALQVLLQMGCDINVQLHGFSLLNQRAGAQRGRQASAGLCAL